MCHILCDAISESISLFTIKSRVSIMLDPELCPIEEVVRSAATNKVVH